MGKFVVSKLYLNKVAKKLKTLNPKEYRKKKQNKNQMGPKKTK